MQLPAGHQSEASSHEPWEWENLGERQSKIKGRRQCQPLAALTDQRSSCPNTEVQYVELKMCSASLLLLGFASRKDPESEAEFEED